MVVDLSLAAFLELKAAAFYFFKKSYSKKLAEKSFGGFEVSDKENFKWITPSEPLHTDEEVETDIKEGLKVNLISFEDKVWTKDEFVKVSSTLFGGERNRILIVDEALAVYDTFRGASIPSDKKISALKNLEKDILNYLKVTAGDSSRTAKVEELTVQIQNALKELYSVVDKELLNE